jgi:enterobactin synthetase component D
MDGTVNGTIAVLREMVPRDCGVSCKFREVPPPILTAEELGRMKDPEDLRRGDFIAGRSAARAALAQIGIFDAVIDSGSRNEPVWPKGIVGSISHSGGLAIAAVARSGALAAIGIDIEQTGAVASDVWADIFQESELVFVNSLPETLRRQVATALFCLKEAYYKYQYPQTGQWLEFKDVEVKMEAGTNQCRLRPRQPITIGGRTLSEVTGHYRTGDTHTLAAVF